MSKKIILMASLLLLILTTAIVLHKEVKPPIEPVYTQANREDINPYSYVNKEEMTEDLRYYLAKVNEVHPNPYRFAAESEVETLFQEIISNINAYSENEMQVIHFHKYVREFNSIFRDEHLTTRLYNTKPEKILPLRFKIINDTLYAQMQSETGMPRFVEVISINEVDANEIITVLLRYQNSALSHTRLIGVERNLNDLGYYFAWHDTYNIIYKDHEVVKELLIAGTMPEQHPSNNPNHYRSYYADQIPVLELNSFSGFNPNDFKSFIDDFFANHANHESIIIDIRQNGGGSSDFGHYVISYLTDQSYTTYQQFNYKISDVLLNKFRYDVERNYYQMKIPNFLWRLPLYRLDREYGPLLKKIFSAEPGSIVEYGPFTAAPHHTPNTFTGDTYLLIGPYTGSAAIDMAAAFKYNDLGTVIGRETSHPHSYFGNTGQSVFEMPNSKIIFSIPITFSLSAKGYDDNRGVLPHIEVHYELEDYLYSTDKEIEAVKKLIKEKP